jgi:hypothetical protein
MMLIGLSLLPIGAQQYPAFLLVGVFYTLIGLRGMGSREKRPRGARVSDESQFESL